LTRSLSYDFAAKGLSIGSEQIQSVTSTLVAQLSRAKTVSTVTTRCDFYDDSSEFTGDCMWQYNIDFESEFGITVEWPTASIRRTQLQFEPPC
jgi:hypothetical protein